jgi:uncharacterized protein (TIGR03437 family)
MHGFPREIIRLAAVGTIAACIVSAATFGKVVSIGGHASDITLDEPRGVLYIANYTASRIDVMSLNDYSIDHSITVAPYPSGVALSPDGRYLVVTHYASGGGGSLAPAGQDALTVLDLTANQRRTFGLSSGPVGVAFGIDGRALILTQDELVLFDPASGQTNVLSTIAGMVKSQSLPAEPVTFPPQITAGALTATPDGRKIFGIGGVTPDTGSKSQFLRFSYNVIYGGVFAEGLVAAPSLGPRVLSVSRDGSYYMTGWALVGCGIGFLGDCTAGGPLVAQWPNSAGSLNVGSVAVRSSKNLIYAQITAKGTTVTKPPTQTCLPDGTCITISVPPPATTPGPSVPTNLMVLDADNLNVRERIQIPENLAGRSVFNSDESVLYAISDSGVTVFPMAQFETAPRVVASSEDVVFRGNFCNGSAPITQQIDITDPSGGRTPFDIALKAGTSCAAANGITFSASSGVTPAHIKVQVDPTVLGSTIGTTACIYEIRSGAAVNMPAPPARGLAESDYQPNVRSRFRILVNNRVPENRGTFIDVPGQLVDLLADPGRNRFYVLRQDKNQIQVYDSSTYNLITTLRTSNTPTQMAITFDRNYLLVGHDDSQLAYRYDLNTLKPVAPIVFPTGHYPRSIAASANAVLAASRVASTDTPALIDRIDMVSLTANPLASLGPYRNGGTKDTDVQPSTTLVASPNGGTILATMGNGGVLLYDANANSFTVSRKDFDSLQGSYAASAYGNYVVGQYFLNDSLVRVGTVVDGSDLSSGFAFVDQGGISTAVRADNGGHATTKGYIRRLTPGTAAPLVTGLVEAPITREADKDYPFTRTLAPLPDQSAIITLTQSGFTVLPWNYEAGMAVPLLDHIVNAADLTKPVAPGGLISVFGSQLSPMSLVSTDTPLPTVLGDSCLTANGMAIPMNFASPTQINGQLPFQMDGKVSLVLHTPGGASDSLNLTIYPSAPAIFRSGTAGPVTGIPTVVRAANNGLVTNSNPIHPNDHVTIYLTGMGKTSPQVDTGAAAPTDTLSSVIIPPTVMLGSMPLAVEFAGLTPDMVGVYQINAAVPFKGVPTGFDIPLQITQGGLSTSVPVRVVD